MQKETFPVSWRSLLTRTGPKNVLVKNNINDISLNLRTTAKYIEECLYGVRKCTKILSSPLCNYRYHEDCCSLQVFGFAFYFMLV